MVKITTSSKQSGPMMPEKGPSETTQEITGIRNADVDVTQAGAAGGVYGGADGGDGGDWWKCDERWWGEVVDDAWWEEVGRAGLALPGPEEEGAAAVAG